MVKIGFYLCKVILYFDVFIKCIIFVNVFGIYDVLVCVDGIGCVVEVGLFFRFLCFKYILYVSGIFFEYGFVLGGIVLIVVGCGFSDNMLVIVVNVGDVFCKVLLSRSIDIMCRMELLFMVYNVDNIGIYLGNILDFWF